MTSRVIGYDSPEGGVPPKDQPFPRISSSYQKLSTLSSWLFIVSNAYSSFLSTESFSSLFRIIWISPILKIRTPPPPWFPHKEAKYLLYSVDLALCLAQGTQQSQKRPSICFHGVLQSSWGSRHRSENHKCQIPIGVRATVEMYTRGQDSGDLIGAFKSRPEEKKKGLKNE